MGMTYDEAFEILVKDGTIYNPPYDAIFDLVSAILICVMNGFGFMQTSVSRFPKKKLMNNIEVTNGY